MKNRNNRMKEATTNMYNDIMIAISWNCRGLGSKHNMEAI